MSARNSESISCWLISKITTVTVDSGSSPSPWVEWVMRAGCLKMDDEPVPWLCLRIHLEVNRCIFRTSDQDGRCVISPDISLTSHAMLTTSVMSQWWPRKQSVPRHVWEGLDVWVTLRGQWSRKDMELWHIMQCYQSRRSIGTMTCFDFRTFPR